MRQMPAVEIQSHLDRIDAHCRNVFADAPEGSILEVYAMVLGCKKASGARATLEKLGENPLFAEFAVQSTLRNLAQILLSRAENREMETQDAKRS